VSFPEVTSIGERVFTYSGSVSLIITMGTAAPTVGRYIFADVTGTKNVTVRVPSGATGYDEAWKTAFKGYGNGTYNGTANENINLVIQEY
jgi:hypothetical protein